jgi:hypothetical protein
MEQLDFSHSVQTFHRPPPGDGKQKGKAKDKLRIAMIAAKVPRLLSLLHKGRLRVVA